MDSKKLLFGLVGLAAGFMISFSWTRSYNASKAGPAPSQAPSGAPMASVREIIERAKNNPNDFEAQVAAAEQFLQINRIEGVIEYLSRAYSIDPKKATEREIPQAIGQWYYEQKNYAEAEKWFRRALEYKPDDAQVLIELGATFIERDPPDPDKAIQYLGSALRLNPKDSHALTHLVEAHLKKKDLKGAEEALSRLKEADSKNENIASLQNQIEALRSAK